MEQFNLSHVKPPISSKSATVTSDKTLLTIRASETVNETNELRSDGRQLRSSYNLLLRSRHRRIIVQDFVLIWLNSKINELDSVFQHSLTELRLIINTIDTFTDADQCIDFISKIKDQKAFMIISDDLGQITVPRIHDMFQLDSIYVFCGEKSEHDQWIQQWRKVKGVFTQIDSICDVLKRDTQRCGRDSISHNVTSADLNRLDPSFMYTQLLKETLIEMLHDDKEMTELAEFCREQFSNNPDTLQIVDELEQDYEKHQPIWWYTRPCFIYEMLNRALRLQEPNIILKMGFFIRHLHQQIEHLYIRPTEKFSVYRGQGLLNVDFEKMRTRQGGLLSFNNFLSTSTDRQVSLLFAECSRENPALTGILFQISIEPALTSTRFASLDNVGYFLDLEKEILFSMHSVFRICQIKPIEDRLWQVELTLANDDDDYELKRLTEHIRQEAEGGTGWYELGKLLIKMGNFDKAEEVYWTLLERTPEDDEKELPRLYHMLGWINDEKGHYKEALMFYHKAVEIKQKFLPPNGLNLAPTYVGIGRVHDKMGEYLEALEYYQRTLEIFLESLPPNHLNLATTYNNIGLVHYNMKQHSKALVFYQKTFEIREKSLPSNHPSLAQIYNNMGRVYDSMGEYSKALEFYQKTLEIQQKSLTPNHPDLAFTYNNIGLAHNNMREYTKALEFHQKALEIREKSLPPKHPNMAITYNNIGVVHDSMGEYSKALSFFERAVEIGQHSLPDDHPLLQPWLQNLAEARKKRLMLNSVK